MTDSTNIPEISDLSREVRERESKRGGRFVRYMLLALGTNVMLWGMALTYLKIAPVTYTSEWSLILPGAGAGSTINLDNVGQASSNVSSPYSGSTVDPKVNYKTIAESKAVLKIAAEQLDLPIEEFGKPRIKLIDQTAVLNFSVTGFNPEQARDKSQALYNAFEEQLDKLRANEEKQRAQSLKATLGSAKEKLREAQQALATYEAKSGLTSTDQFKELALNIEQLRKQQVEVVAEHQKANKQLLQLSGNLGVSPQQAADAFVLQADSIFQQNLKDYAESSTTLEIYLSKWGPNHPKVVKEVARQTAAHNALLRRSQLLVGRELDGKGLQLLNLPSAGNRANLFQDLVSVQAQQRGLGGQAESLDKQIVQLETRLNRQVGKAATLQNLQLNLQVAQAVFSSTLAKTDVSKTDVFASYPLVQVLVEPSLPDEPTSPKGKFVLAGAFLGSVLITTGLVLLWTRETIYRRVTLKNV
ncbi:hypothetical protein [Leptolyngbya sp. FACHB-261]|uniref:GumC family protein n=1 Tax=Leptolyngbya sp. FACHB-261 TaxID=2692806 RepID=UPI0016885DBA|nr:hypothetical protein [Leptolyngbya sp. FACHB-261]MBD2105162.1 hypothetical protein [Leptolyngbya sp. FACHB-261]